MDLPTLIRLNGAFSRPPPDGVVFTPLQMTTTVMSAKVAAPRMGHRELIEKFKKYPPEEPVLAINSNFGGVAASPLYEKFIKQGAKPPPLPPAGRKNRQPEGQGGSLNSSVEPVLRPPPGSEIARRAQEQDALSGRDPGGGGRVYKLKYFPTTGSMQVSGVVLPDHADGDWAIQAWVDFLTDSGVLGGEAAIEAPPKFELVNFKFQLRKTVQRQVINFQAFSEYLAEEARAEDFPAPLLLSTIKHPTEGARASFNFQCGRKKPRVNMFLLSGKINFLGFPSVEFAQELYEFFCRVFREHWARFVALQPPRDRDLNSQLDELLAVLAFPLVEICLPALGLSPEDGRAPRFSPADTELLDEILEEGGSPERGGKKAAGFAGGLAAVPGLDLEDFEFFSSLGE